MRTFFKILALTTAFVPAAVLARPTAEDFTRDGVAYRYTVKNDAHGRQIIDGRRLSDGSAFHLVVAGDTVAGISGGQPVTFHLPTTSAVALAAR